MEPISPWVESFAIYSFIALIFVVVTGVTLLVMTERNYESRDQLEWFDLTLKLVGLSFIWPYYILWLAYKGLRLLIKHARH